MPKIEVESLFSTIEPQQILKSIFESFAPLSEEAWEAFAAGLETVEFSRKELITREGEVERYMYFVVEGIQRGYYVRDGKEFTVAFSFNHSFSGIPESFFTQRPSRYYLEALTKSKLLRQPYSRLEGLFDAHHDLERIMRLATQQVLVGIADRIIEIQAFSAEERFRALLNRSPHVLNMIPQKYLASYLGMDASTFSVLMNSVKLED